MGQGLLPHHCSLHPFNKQSFSLYSVPGKLDRVLVLRALSLVRQADVYTDPDADWAGWVQRTWGSQEGEFTWVREGYM